MSEKTTTGADLVAALSNNTTTAVRKEVTPKVNTELRSQEQTAFLAYLHSVTKTKVKADPEAEKKRKKYHLRLRMDEKVFQEKPEDGDELETIYDTKYVSVWTDEVLAPQQYVVAVGNKSRTKDYQIKYFIKKVLPLQSWAKDVFENVEQYMPTGKGSAR